MIDQEFHEEGLKVNENSCFFENILTQRRTTIQATPATHHKTSLESVWLRWDESVGVVDQYKEGKLGGYVM